MGVDGFVIIFICKSKAQDVLCMVNGKLRMRLEIRSSKIYKMFA